MPVTVISFFPAEGVSPLSDEALDAALKSVRRISPEASRVEVRALDSTYLDMDFPAPGAPPIVKMNDGDMPSPIARAAVILWFEDDLDNVELLAQQAARAIHDALGARGTGTFDARCHLDRTGGTMPSLQALIVIHARADMTRDEFIQYYRTRHVPLAKSLSPRFTRYTTFRLLESIGDFTGDCVTLQEYPSYQDLVDHLNTRVQPTDTAHDDTTNFNAHVTYNIGQRTLIDAV